jgi:hypothetical protein
MSDPKPQQSQTPAPAISNWRKSLAQSFRNNQVTEIAGVLASLEPGASSQSKLMLAMRFEQLIFDKADNIDDYLKKISQRLKRLKKNYKPGEESAEILAERSKAKEEQLEVDMRRRHGAALKYIVQNSNKSMEVMKDKHGEERALLFKQHLDSAEQWAVEIGVIGEGSGPGKRWKRIPREPGYLEKLSEMFQQKRVENIRSHVLKLVDPDVFLGESLTKVEEEILEDDTKLQGTRLSHATRTALANAGVSYPTDLESMKKLIDQLATPVPAPRQGQAKDVKESSVAYMERIRSCSQLLLGFMALCPSDRAQLKGALRKIHNSAVEGLEHLQTFYVETSSLHHDTVQLEDAWTKPLHFQSMEQHLAPHCHVVDTAQHLSSKRLCLPLRSKVLLTPGRKIPSNFLSALESKKAKLIRPESGEGTQIVMSFGDKFTVTIFFQPLLVLIRAISTNCRTDSETSDFQHAIVDGGFPTWTSASYGVQPFGGTYAPLVEEKLEFASARATYVLRCIFADVAGKTYDTAKAEFEVEISEATAILRFLQITRDTYESAKDFVDL